MLWLIVERNVRRGLNSMFAFKILFCFVKIRIVRRVTKEVKADSKEAQNHFKQQSATSSTGRFVTSREACVSKADPPLYCVCNKTILCPLITKKISAG